MSPRGVSSGCGKFLSTPSARRATNAGRLPCSHLQFLSTPSARRATGFHEGGVCVLVISIHALREEGDSRSNGMVPATVDFYPRPPRGGRPCGAYHQSAHHYFYPRPPRGGRPSLMVAGALLWKFLSTPSARRATSHLVEHKRPCAFLSTPSARRATCKILAGKHRTVYFYPRPPRGGRR